MAVSLRWHDRDVVDQYFELVVVEILDELVIVVFELLNAVIVVKELVNGAIFVV
jgi:hypothetical protein